MSENEIDGARSTYKTVEKHVTYFGMKTEWKRPLGKLTSVLEATKRIPEKENGIARTKYGSGQGRVWGVCDHDHVTSRSIKSGNLTVCEIRCSRTRPGGVTYPSLRLT
jgi:hypothetical protein